MLSDVAVGAIINVPGMTQFPIEAGEWTISGMGESIPYAKKSDAAGIKTGEFMSFRIAHSSGTVRRVSSFDLARFLVGVKGKAQSDLIAEELTDGKGVQVERAFTVIDSTPQLIEGTSDKMYPKAFYKSYSQYKMMSGNPAGAVSEDSLLLSLYASGVEDKYKERYYRVITLDESTPALSVVDK